MNEEVPELPRPPEEIIQLEIELKWLAHEYFASIRRVQGHQRMIQHLHEQYPDTAIEKMVCNPIQEILENLHREIDANARRLVKQHPVWHGFFNHIRGAGYTVALFLLGMAPAWKYPNISKLWKDIGLAPRHVYGGRKAYRVKVKWAVYSALRSMLMQGPNGCKYARQYYYWREEIDQDKNYKDTPKWMKHLIVMKRVAKMFTGHYWEVYRKTFNLPIVPPYFVVKGMKQLYIAPEEMFDK